MRSPVSRGWFVILLGALFAALPSPLLHAEEEKTDPRVHEVAAKVEGKTYAQWSELWWQWAARIKKDRNPVLDKTRAFAGEGQDGPVWFLAGNIGGKSVRKCVVPAGKPIFFPVINGIENAPPDKADEKKLRAEAKAAIDRATDLEATLDGKPITGPGRFRVASGAFTVTGPEKAAEAPFDDIVGKQKAISDGYWLMLRPLSVGKHTLHFKGKLKPAPGKEPFDLDVTYEVTVREK
jgi:hypothetical protein